MNDDIVKTTLQCPFIESESICIQCDCILIASIICTCCHGKFNLGRVTIFNPQNYNFEDYVESHALASQHCTLNGDAEYIYNTCHNNLATKDNHIPIMPWKVIAHKTSVLGSKFLQAIHEKPEFVCTCCHWWLFQKTVMKYDESKYDMTNDIVKETLDTKYHHKMNVAIVKGMCCAHEHPIDYDYSDAESDDNDNNDETIADTSSNETSDASTHTVTYKIYEYICITCHNSLKRNKTKMPSQTCANGLLLSKIPPVLLNLTDLEWRIISLRIPFMVIFYMVRYGS